MPLTKYFKGDGPEGMADMVSRYGAKKGKEVFYATANTQKNLDHHIGKTIKTLRRKHHIARKLAKRDMTHADGESKNK